MLKRMVATALLVLLVLPAPSSACTIFMAVQGDTVLVGNNLDAGNYFPRMWFVPAVDGQYGRVCFGFDENFKIAEGGMNDQGLYISVNALNEETGWKSDPTLPNWEDWEGWFESGVPDGILAMCATVEEAIEIFKGYNLFTFQKVKFLLADKTGDSVVIEWGVAGLKFLKRPGRHFDISTNFVTSDYAPEDIPCYRYTLAKQMFENTGDISVDTFRAVLSATHLEFYTPTVYSNICNLGTGEMHIYYFHNYEEVVKINLYEQLSKGRSEFMLRDMFSVKPYVAQVYEDQVKSE